MRRAVLAGAAVGLVAVGAVSVAVLSGSGGAAGPATTDAAVSTATVTRRDLVLREDVDGTLGFGDPRSIVAVSAGVVTRLPAEGSVVTRGEALYDVDARGVRLLYGTMPLWRPLSVGVEDGDDVEQLERNLVELGYDPDGMTVDGTFDADTAAAVRAWQDALGVPETGRVDPQDAVFLPGPRRIGKVATTVGARLQPGMEVLQVTGTTQLVEIDLDAREQELARVGATALIELPSGRTLTGTVAAVGRVAVPSTTAQGEEGDPTVEVVVRLPRRGTHVDLDGAPVVVSLERERARNVLAVPVEALLALKGGGDAVEVVDRDGEHVLTAVETGPFADGFVEISGKGIKAGTRVVVPE